MKIKKYISKASVGLAVENNNWLFSCLNFVVLICLHLIQRSGLLTVLINIHHWVDDDGVKCGTNEPDQATHQQVVAPPLEDTHHL